MHRISNPWISNGGRENGKSSEPKHIQSLSNHKAKAQQPLQRPAINLRGLHLRRRNIGAMAGAPASGEPSVRPLVLPKVSFHMLFQIHRRPHQ